MTIIEKKQKLLDIEQQELELLKAKASLRYKANKHNKRWRLFSGSIYRIKDKEGNNVKFIPNDAQEFYYDNRHNKNVILKSRQRGFTTLAVLDALDDALFEDNFGAGLIAQDLDTSRDIFDNKVIFAYDNIDDYILEDLGITKTIDRQGEIKLSNNSKLSVDNSFRSGTLQKLHISELGKISVKYPEKAREIKTGALNTVAKNQSICIESTAEGASGEFFEVCNKALELEESGEELTDMDYKFFFFPWFTDKDCSLEGTFTITQETIEYFDNLKHDRYIQKHYPDFVFTESKMRFYQKKKEEQKDDMPREFPSTPEEAFKLAVRGSYYKKELSLAREQGRVAKVHYDPKLLVNVAIDIGGAGGGDDMVVWFFQVFGKEIRIIDYWEGVGFTTTSLHHTVLSKKDYNYGVANLPWDASIVNQSDGNSVEKTFQSFGYKTKIIRIKSVALSIDKTRDMFINFYFDQGKCNVGIDHIALYTRKWDKTRGCFSNQPDHNEHSHAADALRYLAEGADHVNVDPNKEIDDSYDTYLESLHGT